MQTKLGLSLLGEMQFFAGLKVLREPGEGEIASI